MLKNLVITRIYQTDEATHGLCGLFDADGKMLQSFHTLELPWKQNQRNVSCIPEGSYLASREYHTKKGHVFRLHNVEGRSGILIHVGNSLDDTEGCILLGLTSDLISHVVAKSTVAMKTLNLYPSLFRGSFLCPPIYQIYNPSGSRLRLSSCM